MYAIPRRPQNQIGVASLSLGPALWLLLNFYGSGSGSAPPMGLASHLPALLLPLLRLFMEGFLTTAACLIAIYPWARP